jgi:hypothetical protein
MRNILHESEPQPYTGSVAYQTLERFKTKLDRRITELSQRLEVIATDPSKSPRYHKQVMAQVVEARAIRQLLADSINNHGKEP